MLVCQGEELEGRVRGGISATSVAEASIHSRQAIFLCLFPARPCCWGNYHFMAPPLEDFIKHQFMLGNLSNV